MQNTTSSTRLRSNVWCSKTSTKRFQPKGDKVYVQGSAIWQGGQAVHTGELDHAVLLNGNRLYYQEGDRDACSLTIHLVPQELKVTDDNLRCGGLNVSNYRKIK